LMLEGDRRGAGSGRLQNDLTIALDGGGIGRTGGVIAEGGSGNSRGVMGVRKLHRWE